MNNWLKIFCDMYLVKTQEQDGVWMESQHCTSLRARSPSNRVERRQSGSFFLKKSMELSTARQVDTLCEGKRGQRLVKKWKRESGGVYVAVSN